MSTLKLSGSAGGTGNFTVTPPAGANVDRTLTLPDVTGTLAVVNRAYAEYTANANLTTQIPADDTLPQNTEGTQILSVSFTPQSTTSRVRLRFQGQFTLDAVAGGVAAIFSSASASALATTLKTVPSSGYREMMVMEHEYVPGVTTALTFTVRVGPGSAATMRMNGNNSAREFGGSMKATLIVEEIAA